MKILGIGVDITKNSRIKELIKNKSFINRNLARLHKFKGRAAIFLKH